MADMSVNQTRHRGHQSHDRLEYRMYFAVIFLIALPFAVIAHLWAVMRHAKAPELGPIARARAEAHGIAPMIFRA